ncbi:MAG: dienelactone hydrolase family protein [Acidobacteria bacterium]|nr:dienelactone hydrolase family protein [Acidobacteriota bacterium]
MTTRRFILIVLLCLLMPAVALAQALPNLATTRVRYNTLKATTNPQGELKAQIDAIDRELVEATRLGRTGEVRRLFANGTALLNGRQWTELDDFDQSLVVRTDRVFADSTVPYQVRLEQIYAPAISLTSSLTARATLRPLLSQPAGAADVRELGRFDGVSRDLRESPFGIELNLSGVADAPYMLDIEILDDARSLGTASLRVAVQQGLEARLRALDTAAAKGPASVGADLRYPMDFMRKVNRGLVEPGSFDLAKELAAAEAVAAAARGGADPFPKRTGDFERHYVLEEAREIMPYRVHVPKAYNGSKPFPLIVALHGLGANEDSFLDGYSKRLPELAEQHGYLVAAPLGYRVDGFYGSGVAGSNDPVTRRTRELSEQDVMQVLARMRRDYKIDEQRIYLMGHSMGAIGTWYLTAKYPDVWAAVAPFSGLGTPASVARMKHIPQFVVHGDADPTVNVSGSRTMVAEMKKLGVDVTYIEVAGGNHINVVVPNLAAMMDFFDAKRKAVPTTQQR